jgi:hypothetical protein
VDGSGRKAAADAAEMVDFRFEVAARRARRSAAYGRFFK